MGPWSHRVEDRMFAENAVRLTVVVACLTIAPAFAAEAPHWSYGKDHGGPAQWSHLGPEYATCGVGKLQSPIDIRGARKADLPAIEFAYAPFGPTVVNNGHTIQVPVPPGSTITVGDHRYELQQLHFHTPSEEAVSGKHAPLVAHLVHKDADGKLAVVAVLFDVGGESAALAPVFARLPAKPGTEVAVEGVTLDVARILPSKQGYYEFEGSLTTPPCTEGVRWLVLQARSTVSKAQLDAFRKLYPNNARPVQPLNGRTIQISG
jgi:carbonic anhydrase